MPEVMTSLDGVDFTRFCVLQTQEPTPISYKLPRSVASSQSIILRDLLEDHEEANAGGANTAIIPIPNISAKTLSLVVDYMIHHGERRPPPLQRPLKAPLKDLLTDEFDKTFLFTKLVPDIQQHEKLIDVAMAANFLNMPGLLELACACLADLIRGKSAEEIRRVFNIENDFTEEEERKIEEENLWCEEA